MDETDKIDEILAREQQLGMGSMVTVRVNPAEKATLTQVAAKMRVSVSALMRMGILEWLENRFPEYSTWYYYNLEKMTINLTTEDIIDD